MKNKPLVSVIVPTYNRIKQLERLLTSIAMASYGSVEIIVVNNSNGEIPNVILNGATCIENRRNKGLAYARSIGAMNAQGKYILFIDDDNEISPNMITELVSAFECRKDIIGIGPVTYYLKDRKKIWFVSVVINLFTSKPTFNVKLNKTGKYINTDNLHNCFMVKRDDGEAVGWFDKNVFLTGTEFDLFMRLKNFKRKSNKECNLYTIRSARCYHDMPLKQRNVLRRLGFTNDKRVYYLQRNRGLLIGRYGTALNKIIFGFIFYPIFTLLYSLIFVVFGKTTYLKKHIKGTIDGYRLLIKKHEKNTIYK